MFSILANWILSALIILLISQYLPGFIVNSFLTALTVALVLGIVNAFIKPVVMLLTLPINIMTLGLFTFVINALLIWGISAFVAGFTITGFVPALVGAIALWFINLLINLVIFPVKTV